MPVYPTHQLTILNCGRVRDLFSTTPSLRKKKGTIQLGSGLLANWQARYSSPVNNRSGVGDGLYYDAAKNGHPTGCRCLLAHARAGHTWTLHFASATDPTDVVMGALINEGDPAPSLNGGEGGDHLHTAARFE
ncbi:hypothetical protein CDAR_442301 [Caerostris darwini]|uniref:Uncharacterized protein n=1 Tax=Caerostris darwini TaxID=1538125 RepID=A0AAV4V089_9ARAC|nr:hypothetical protein CDAR_442301 [Caerostris darwini]